MSVDYFTPDPSDADALAALHVACWKETYGEILPAEIIDKLSVAEKAAMWRGVIADAGVFKLAVRKDGALAGFVMCGPARDGAGLGGDGQGLVFASTWRRHVITLRHSFSLFDMQDVRCTWF